MHVDVHFTNIENIICDYIEEYDTIFVCSAWFSSKAILSKISERNSLVIVSWNESLLEGTSNCNISWLKELETYEVSLRMLNDKEKLLHSKYIILLKEKIPEAVITGSYNFTERAKENIENIVYIKDSSIASNYLENFKELIKRTIRII